MSIRNLYSEEFPPTKTSVSIAKDASTSTLSVNVVINDSRIRAMQIGGIVVCYAFFDVTTSNNSPYSFHVQLPILPSGLLANDIQCAGISVWDNGGAPTTGTVQVVPMSQNILVSQPSSATTSGKLVVHFCYELNL